MISRFHRLWAITSTLLCLAALSYSQEEEFEATLSTPVVIDTNTGDLVATDNAQLTYGDWLVSADEIRLNQQTNRAIAGEEKYEFPERALANWVVESRTKIPPRGLAGFWSLFDNPQKTHNFRFHFLLWTPVVPENEGP